MKYCKITRVELNETMVSTKNSLLKWEKPSTPLKRTFLLWGNYYNWLDSIKAA